MKQYRVCRKSGLFPVVAAATVAILGSGVSHDASRASAAPPPAPDDAGALVDPDVVNAAFGLGRRIAWGRKPPHRCGNDRPIVGVRAATRFRQHPAA